MEEVVRSVACKFAEVELVIFDDVVRRTDGVVDFEVEVPRGVLEVVLTMLDRDEGRGVIEEVSVGWGGWRGGGAQYTIWRNERAASENQRRLNSKRIN